MVLTDKLTAIANAIRTKNGESGAYTLDEMPTAILGLSSGDIDAIPSYVKTEARRVINAVAPYQNSNTVTFLAMADPHQMVSESTATNIQNNNTANKHAGLAAKVIAQAIDLDFATMLGDFCWGSSTTTIEDGKEEIRLINEYLNEAFANIPNFRTVGNHDALISSYSQNVSYLKPSQLYELIGKYNEGVIVDSLNPQRGYCYRDFTDKKLRVICLNTADGEENAANPENMKERISGAQMSWFASALDLSAKTNYSQWQILILSHHPIDWGTVNPLTKIVNAYVNGTSVSFTHNGTAVSYNYSGKNGTTIIANIHGHTHCFKTDNLYLINSGAGTAIDNTRRIAVPNACFTRTNEYGESGSTDINGIEYGDTITYNKTANSAEDTAFCVFVIDLTSRIIRAFHYGAGVDRTLDYSNIISTYTVTNTLSDVTTNNSAASIKSNQTYSATLTAASGYNIGTVKVEMGGVDITSTAYSNGVVTIANPTGNIVITASGEAVPTYTNLIPTATTTDGVTIYNGKGYKDGQYVSENASKKIYFSADSAFWATGIMPWDTSKPLYIKGWTWNTNSHSRLYIVTGSAGGSVSNAFGYNRGSDTTLATNFSVTTLDASVNYVKLEAKSTGLKNAGTVYFALSMPGTGAGVIITEDEPIE